MSARSKLVFLALVACGTVFTCGDTVYAQERTYQRLQFESEVPPVDLPSAATEANIDASAGSVGQPMSQGAMAEPYIEGDYSAGSGYGYEGDYDIGYADQGYVDGAEVPTPMEQSYDAGAYESALGQGVDAFGSNVDAPAPVFSTGTWWWRGQWYTILDVVAIDRDDFRRIPLTTAAGETYAIDDLVQHDHAQGYRLTLGKFLGQDSAVRDHMIEASFFGAFSWDGQRTLASLNPDNSVNLGALTVSNADNTPNLEFQESVPFFNSSTGALLSNDLTNTYVASDRQTFRYVTDLNDIQLNYRLQTRPGGDVMALQPNGMWVRHAVSSQIRSFFGGMRLAFLTERAQFSAERDLLGEQVIIDDSLNPGTPFSTENTALAANPDFANYDLKTDNNMFGIHFGGEVVEKRDNWSFGIKGKIGTMLNFVQRRSSLNATLQDPNGTTDTVGAPIRRTDGNGNPLFVDNITGDETTDATDATGADNMILEDTPTTTTFDYTARVINPFTETIDTSRCTFVLETGVFGKYQLRPNLAFRCGYDFLVYTGIAVAPENMGLEDMSFKRWDVTGHAFYHGGFAGFETTW